MDHQQLSEAWLKTGYPGDALRLFWQDYRQHDSKDGKHLHRGERLPQCRSIDKLAVS